jgi:hypothetical protein
MEAGPRVTSWEAVFAQRFALPATGDVRPGLPGQALFVFAESDMLSLDAGAFDFVDAVRTAPQFHAIEFRPPPENFLGDDHDFCISLAGHLLAIAYPPLSAQQEVSIVSHRDHRHRCSIG